MNEAWRHLEANELALLAERGSDQAEPEVLTHLATCAACLEAYAEAVRVVDADLAGAAPAAASAPLLQLVPRRRRRGMAAWATGGLATAAVLLLLVLVPARDGGVFDPRPVLQAQLAALSSDGLLLPGVEHLEDGTAARYRDGAGSSDVEALLDPLARRYDADPGDADAAYWLGAGYLASGRLNYADDLLRRALQRHPDDGGLRRLEAATAYRLNELDRAEQILRELRDHDAGAADVRFNLALIAVERGRPEEARAALPGLAADAAHPAVQARARALLADLDR
ncbi:MAG TPA: tetratricopeptide repeat protein [Candidatus Krumholzibacteria bacterium]|nr:tetratricopeptide repeat protein [Candidatus Krumholzibacteria bacterium]